MKSPPPQLRSYYEARKRRTASAVNNAVLYLRKNNLRISLASIREAVSKQSDGRHRISESTIQRNPEARKLYMNAATAKPRNQSLLTKRHLEQLSEGDRVLERSALTSFRRKTKTELVLHASQQEQKIRHLEKELAHLRAVALEKKLSLLESQQRGRIRNAP